MATIVGIVNAAAIGGVDGLASSRDANRGRSWGTPGVAVSAIPLPVLTWGWAPVTQIAALGIGSVAATRGRSWGMAWACAGAGLLARAAAFSLAQGRAGTGVATQGYTYGPNDRMGGTDQAYARGAMRPVYPGGGFDNSWDPTSRVPAGTGSPGNAYIGGPFDRATPAPGDSPGNGMVARGNVQMGPFDPNASGPVQARAWSQVAGVYGSPSAGAGGVLKQQAGGVL